MSKNKKRRTQKYIRDPVHSALDHLKRSAVHRQGKDEWVERNVVKKRRQEKPFDSSARR